MKKVDFIATVVVKNANPNGDPLAGNMPRTDSRGYGEMSDVCIKRKVRNRLQDINAEEFAEIKERLNSGNDIFVKSNGRIDDDCTSMESRYKTLGFTKNTPDEEVEKTLNEKWIDIRSFGQVVTYDKKSIGIRGPVSISLAKSLDPIEITTMQITRSTNGMEAAAGKGRSSDTMGTKHFVDFAVYKIAGAVSPYFAEKTGFNEDDLDRIKESIRTLFINDASSARPEGSMEVKEVFWFKHSNKIGNVSSAKIQNLFEYCDEGNKEQYEDYNIHLNEKKLEKYKEMGLEVEIFEGI